MKPVQPCGTYAAYERHRRRGEQPDQDCVDAARTYSAARHQRNRHHQRHEDAARRRAHRRLAAAHQTEFRALYLRELARNTTRQETTAR